MAQGMKVMALSQLMVGAFLEVSQYMEVLQVEAVLVARFGCTEYCKRIGAGVEILVE